MSGEGYFVHQFPLGPWDNFIYLLGDEKSKRCAVVDPAWHAPSILAQAEAKGLTITDVLCTHGHFDHINAVDDIVDATDAAVHMLGEEIDFSTRSDAPGRQAMNYLSPNLKRKRPGDVVRIGDELDITLLHTPGHTPGSTSYLVNEQLVAGDTLFVDGCGRCDFIGGDPAQMFQTLQNLVDKLPGQTTLLPGHDYGPTASSPLSDQASTNPYLTANTLEDFVAHRMSGKTPGNRLPDEPQWAPPHSHD